MIVVLVLLVLVFMYLFIFNTQAEKDVELVAKWRHCALSAEKLQQPIVACGLGRYTIIYYILIL